MSYAIHWTDESKTTINENLEYLSRKWDLKTMNTFLNRVEEVLESIAQNPNLYPVHRKSDKVHKCVVNKHSTLYISESPVQKELT